MESISKNISDFAEYNGVKLNPEYTAEYNGAVYKGTKLVGHTHNTLEGTILILQDKKTIVHLYDRTRDSISGEVIFDDICSVFYYSYGISDNSHNFISKYKDGTIIRIEDGKATVSTEDYIYQYDLGENVNFDTILSGVKKVTLNHTVPSQRINLIIEPQSGRVLQ